MTASRSIPTEWSRPGLEAAGFTGFVPFAALPEADVPSEAGIYAVLSQEQPEYLDMSVAGWFEGRNPSVPVHELREAWVEGTTVVYIGKAGAGKNGDRGIRKRLDEFACFGSGKPVGHWGGRFIFQLGQPERLSVCWKPTPGEDVGDVESALIRAFVSVYGKRPFANRNAGRRRRA